MKDSEELYYLDDIRLGISSAEVLMAIFIRLKISWRSGSWLSNCKKTKKLRR